MFTSWKTSRTRVYNPFTDQIVTTWSLATLSRTFSYVYSRPN